MEPLHIPTANDFLYVQMAARIEKQVKQNLLKPGDKLPSVRALSQEQGISLSTAFKTYTELETLGIIEAMPKSGYYVRFRPARFSEIPETKPPVKKIRQASVAQIIAMVDKNMHEEAYCVYRCLL